MDVTFMPFSLITYHSTLRTEYFYKHCIFYYFLAIMSSFWIKELLMSQLTDFHYFRVFSSFCLFVSFSTRFSPYFSIISLLWTVFVFISDLRRCVWKRKSTFSLDLLFVICYYSFLSTKKSRQKSKTKLFIKYQIVSWHMKIATITSRKDRNASYKCMHVANFKKYIVITMYHANIANSLYFAFCTVKKHI